MFAVEKKTAGKDKSSMLFSSFVPCHSDAITWIFQPSLCQKRESNEDFLLYF